MPKFELQDCYAPERTATLDIDTDRSSCCGACVVYLSAEYKRTSMGLFEVGGYEGCEECGAMTEKVPVERPDPEPYTAKEIVTAMENTYQSCGHDVGGEWPGSAVLDFVVSGKGQYADNWSDDRYWNTPDSITSHAVVVFNRRYGFTE